MASSPKHEDLQRTINPSFPVSASPPLFDTTCRHMEVRRKSVSLRVDDSTTQKSLKEFRMVDSIKTFCAHGSRLIDLETAALKKSQKWR